MAGLRLAAAALRAAPAARLAAAPVRAREQPEAERERRLARAGRRAAPEQAQLAAADGPSRVRVACRQPVAALLERAGRLRVRAVQLGAAARKTSPVSSRLQRRRAT